MTNAPLYQSYLKPPPDNRDNWTMVSCIHSQHEPVILYIPVFDFRWLTKIINPFWIKGYTITIIPIV